MSDIKSLPQDATSPFRLKTPLTVWVIFFDEEFKLHIAHELTNCLGVSFEFLAMGKISADIFRSNDLPDILFVQTGTGWAEKVIGLQELDIDHDQDMSLVVLGDHDDNAALRMALRLGASDFLSDQVTADELMPLFCSVADSKIASTTLAEVYVFANTKGGTGATTICLNAAVDVAKNCDGKVLYLDLDQHFGVTNDYLNIHPSYSITDAIASYDDLDDISLQSLVTRHDSGLNVLTFNPETHVENFEKSKHIGRLIPVLRHYYKYIFVDLSSGLDRMYVSVFTQSTKLFVVTQQNLVALKNASRIVRSLKYEYGMPNDAMMLVINRYEKRQQIKLKDIENSFVGLDIYTIPNDFKVAIESANLGEPFVITKPHALISQSIHEFCKTFSIEVAEEKGWLGKFFS